MRGFYSESELEKKTRLNFDIGKHPNCNDCGLWRKCKSPKMKPHGKGKLGVLELAEGPGEDEDDYNTQLCGRVGKWFANALRDNCDLDLNTNFYKYNAVNCWPHDKKTGRKPTNEEIRLCRPNVVKAIEELQPKYIWAMGSCACESLFGTHFSNTSISRWRGLAIPDRKTGAWIVPIFHPSYAMRNEGDKNTISLYERDLRFAHSVLKRKPFEHGPDPESCVSILTDFTKVVSLLQSLIDYPPKILYFDYETSGLKPYASGHFIASISLSTDGKRAYSFPFDYRNHWTKQERRKIKQLWRKVLTKSKVSYEAHNAKFEHVWTNTLMGVNVENWGWDGMLSAHIIDNRPKFTKLKFQVYLHLGIPPYDKDIAHYLEGHGKNGANNFNRVNDAPLGDLLLYGGFDSLFGFQINAIHKKLVSKRRLQEAMDFFMEATPVLAELEMNGIHASEEYYIEQDKKLERQINRLDRKLKEGEEAQTFQEMFGRPIKFTSNQDLAKLVVDVLGHELPQTEADNDNYKTDKDTLEKTGLPFIKRLLKKKKLEKVKGTYLAQFKREIIDDQLHPFFSINIPVSYRGSSYSPNFQNIPIRDEDSKRMCRGGILPSLGNMLLEWDYGGVEVCTSACYHKDPNMIKYITDPNSDMHRDNACDIWMLPQEEITSIIRFYIKNGWTFPQFYGDWYGSCAPNLWNICIDMKTKSGIILKDHLASKGIYDLEEFTSHCKKAEDIMWYERFPVYTEWKNEIEREYQKKGFISTHFGFEFRGIMGKKELGNYPIQGTAFHILLWTLIQVVKELKARRMRAKVIGQIHDSGVKDLYPPELNDVCEMITHIGTDLIKKLFPWIVVPLTIDFELTKVDQPWNTKETIIPAHCDYCHSKWAYKEYECAICGEQIMPF